MLDHSLELLILSLSKGEARFAPANAMVWGDHCERRTPRAQASGAAREALVRLG
jgi:hypothetical protein